ncbi:hypothetical protein M231_00897 [Tremella mesenterica]|uniref:Uncharacterized protein n=1 Tax=Tremella mesenterica TaxID=5217 RepID=A0A4Q1BV21_TREME|nr:hypothetical protein M231_00897 [Tremella mesenterica]
MNPTERNDDACTVLLRSLGIKDFSPSFTSMGGTQVVPTSNDDPQIENDPLSILITLIAAYQANAGSTQLQLSQMGTQPSQMGMQPLEDHSSGSTGLLPATDLIPYHPLTENPYTSQSNGSCLSQEAIIKKVSQSLALFLRCTMVSITSLIQLVKEDLETSQSWTECMDPGYTEILQRSEHCHTLIQSLTAWGLIGEQMTLFLLAVPVLLRTTDDLIRMVKEEMGYMSVDEFDARVESYRNSRGLFLGTLKLAQVALGREMRVSSGDLEFLL